MKRSPWVPQGLRRDGKDCLQSSLDSIDVDGAILLILDVSGKMKMCVDTGDSFFVWRGWAEFF